MSGLKLRLVPSPEDRSQSTSQEQNEIETQSKTNLTEATIEVNDSDHDHIHEEQEAHPLATGKGSSYQRAIICLQKRLMIWYQKNSRAIHLVATIFFTILYFGYFGYAIYYRTSDEGAWRLIILTIFASSVIVYKNINRIYAAEFGKCWTSAKPILQSSTILKIRIYIKWFLRVVTTVVIAIYVFIEVVLEHPENLISVLGLIVTILVFFVTSKAPEKVNWHTVFWGIALQYLFAVLILRTYWGYTLFDWCGERVREFLDHASDGIVFMFGEKASDHSFAMMLFPIVAFFRAFVSVLYYIGVMQVLVAVIGKFLAFCLDTTPAESISTGANIFVSMIESPILIRPFLKDMTNSELHAVMTGGYATIAGSALVIFTSFGVSAKHLMSASVMSAPAALALSKLSYPETEISKGTSKDFDNLKKSTEVNLMEAISNGATSSLKLIGVIAANLIAFISLLACFNATLTWFGERVGVEKLTFEMISSYVLYPVAYLMGTDTGDCGKVAELLGIKTFLNEFVAYIHLKDLIANRHTLTNYTEFYNSTSWHWEKEDMILDMTGETLKGGILSVKSEVIATYALCGFANFGSIGITLGAVGALAPSKKSDLAAMSLRSMICGNVACFLTACIAEPDNDVKANGSWNVLQKGPMVMSDIKLRLVNPADGGIEKDVVEENKLINETKIKGDCSETVVIELTDYRSTIEEQTTSLFESKENYYQVALQRLQDDIAYWYRGYSAKIIFTAGIIFAILCLGYLGYAIYYRFGDEPSWRLLGLSMLVTSLIVYNKVRNTNKFGNDKWRDAIDTFIQSTACFKTKLYIRRSLRFVAAAVILIYTVLEVVESPGNLISVAGLVLCILVFYVTSVAPARVNWHTVFWGIALQYIFALLILRTYWGYAMFDWIGDRVTEFLHHVTSGMVFVFGEAAVDHPFAMTVLPIVPFFITIVNILYYYGVMQAIIRNVGKFLAYCLDTTPAESINTGANIFVSMIESPLLIKPFLMDMTNSELHAVMTGGFATIAGAVLVSFISFGISAKHLMSASVMSAPAALALSKLSYPETERSKGTSKDFDNLEKSKEVNIIEAATNGATSSVKIVGVIAVNCIAFLSLLAVFNATLTWLGERVGVELLTLEMISSYVLYPVAYLMGTDTGDCGKVAELLGVKTFLNEFVAYIRMKDLIENRKTLNNYTEFYHTTDWHWQNDNIVLNITGEVLKGGALSLKSEVIATYALCGFANFGAMGITLGVLGTLIPAKKSSLAKMALRAMICGNMACFLTACIAGLLFKEYD